MIATFKVSFFLIIVLINLYTAKTPSMIMVRALSSPFYAFFPHFLLFVSVEVGSIFNVQWMIVMMSQP
jgi:hypothetical protein